MTATLFRIYRATFKSQETSANLAFTTKRKTASQDRTQFSCL